MVASRITFVLSVVWPRLRGIADAAAQSGWATMWATTNQDLIGSSCEYANAPVDSLTDPVLASYLRTGYHCAIGEEFGIGEPCGKCYRLTSLNDNGRHGTPGATSSAVVMVSNSGAGGTNHFDCILESFQAITGATSGVFDITYEQTACTDVSGVPTIINWADQNAWYCKMMFENIGGWGSLHTVRACLDGSKCSDLQRFSGQTWTGCPTGTGSTMDFTLTQQSPSGDVSTIHCTCSVGAWPWPTGRRCECPANFVSRDDSGSTTSSRMSETTTIGDHVPATTTPGDVPATTTPGATCSATQEDCRATKCCSDSALTCFEKNQWYATCIVTCTVGVNPNDPPEYQTPWTCAVLSPAASTTAAIESTTTITVGTTIADPISTTSTVTMAHTTTTVTSTVAPMTTIAVPTTSTTTAIPSTTMATTTSSVAGRVLQSGDTIFLKTYAGLGNVIDVENAFVQARWSDRGTWQAFVIETESGGEVLSGDKVYLKSHTGAFIDVEDSVVQARWSDKGTWQSLVIESLAGGGGIHSSDTVCLRTHMGNYIHAEGIALSALWRECGSWQHMRIDREDNHAIFSGQMVSLFSHAGKFLEAEDELVQARWNDRGAWQSFRIENSGGRAIFSGDTVFLAAHTGKMIDVESTAVQARYADRGDWQRLIVRSTVGGAIVPGDTIFLQAHTGNYLDVEGFEVKARWNDRGAWQALVIESGEARRLNDANISNLQMDASRGVSIGVLAGLLAFVSGMVLLAALVCKFGRTRGKSKTSSVHPHAVQDII